MARQAEADGIDAVCATPHIRDDHDVDIHDLRRRRAQLREALREARCTTQILAGGEVATPAVARLGDLDLAAVALGGSGWILLEPSPGPLGDDLDVAVDALAARGYRALIAHPERHLTEDLVARLARLTERGALVQATAAYLLYPGTREGMLTLAAAGVVHVLATDAHSSRVGRPVALAAALAELAAVPRVAPHLEWIGVTAPEALVNGAPLHPPFAATAR